MITLEMGASGTADGASPARCARELTAAGASIIGVNCSYDPAACLDVIAAMRGHGWLACQPVGFRTGAVSLYQCGEFPLALETRQLTRFELASFCRQAAELGVRYIGGCCGVSSYHIRSMAEALGRRPASSAKSPDLSRHLDPRVTAREDPNHWEGTMVP
jgi:methionine synthase I (cobalamin-dependent)